MKYFPWFFVLAFSQALLVAETPDDTVAYDQSDIRRDEIRRQAMRHQSVRDDERRQQIRRDEERNAANRQQIQKDEVRRQQQRLETEKKQNTNDTPPPRLFDNGEDPAG
jgi:hypothetical protein